jgi:hypothetical protein
MRAIVLARSRAQADWAAETFARVLISCIPRLSWRCCSDRTATTIALRFWITSIHVDCDRQFSRPMNALYRRCFPAFQQGLWCYTPSSYDNRATSLIWSCQSLAPSRTGHSCSHDCRGLSLSTSQTLVRRIPMIFYDLCTWTYWPWVLWVFGAIDVDVNWTCTTVARNCIVDLWDVWLFRKCRRDTVLWDKGM